MPAPLSCIVGPKGSKLLLLRLRHTGRSILPTDASAARRHRVVNRVGRHDALAWMAIGRVAILDC